MSRGRLILRGVAQEIHVGLLGDSLAELREIMQGSLWWGVRCWGRVAAGICGWGATGPGLKAGFSS